MLDKVQLAELAAFDTPTICNALELVAPERRTVGFTTKTLMCPLPARMPLVGYAKTAAIVSSTPPTESADTLQIIRRDYFRYVAEGGYDKIMVIQDVDERRGFGSWWGEVNSAIHRGLGCVGLVTDGSVRDLDDIAPDFGVLCAEVVPSHGWVRPVAFGEDVEVFEMAVSSGDLVHADRHGAVVIPHEVAADVASAAMRCRENEAPILAAARSRGFTVADLEAVTSAREGMH